MKEKTRKEIEAKLHQLIAKSGKPKELKTTPNSALIGAKVIRRRKGQIDLPIT